MLLVGAGLANGLIALRLAALRPELEVVALEAAPRPGGNHTWSFHESDLTVEQDAWLAPLVAHRWPAQSVRFPAFRRRFATGYRSIPSERLAAALEALPNLELRCGTEVATVAPDGVTLADGARLAADCVIDGRGFRPSAHLQLGFQKFVGLELRFAAPHGVAEPVIMDATVDQGGDYRFFYLLPFGADRLLIEDTRYSDAPDLDRGRMAEEILGYAAAQGWAIDERLREEAGVLPITLAGDAEAFWADMPAGVPPVGLRAGLFHPTTGYSLPDAVRLAELVAETRPLSSAALYERIRAYALARWEAQGLFRFLNRMLFDAADGAGRYRVLQRFYRLPEPLIRRFYAGSPTFADKTRLLVGKPPVPIPAALGCISERAFRRRPRRNLVAGAV